MKNIRIISIIFFLSAPLITFCHELQVVVDLRPPFVVVHSQYGDNEFCSYADVSIFGPESDSTEFQIGNADVNGNFSFLPDRPGMWTVKVDDGMGHVKKAGIEVMESFFSDQEMGINSSAVSADADRSAEKISVYLKAVIGLSLIFGITGILYWIKASRVIKNRERSIEA